jgi:hypothetical protein
MQEILRDKKVKEALRNKDRERKLQKAKNLSNNAPLSKYYREQLNQPDFVP